MTAVDAAWPLVRAVAHEVHHRVVPAFLRWWPAPVWHGPALVLATIRALIEPGPWRQIAPAALRALGYPVTGIARWRFGWRLYYHREVDLLLRLQASRLTAAWVRAHLRICGAPPAGGAVLVLPHHANMRLALLVAGAWVPRLAIISGIPGDEQTLAAYGRAASDQDRALRVFLPTEAARQGVRWLQAGGYLAVMPDFDPRARGEPWPVAAILGKAMPLAPGPVWLAQRAQKPIGPVMVTPAGRGWQVWCGEPIAPTQEGLAGAIEACIGRSPASWSLELWRRWQQAPPTRQHDAAGPRGRADATAR